MKREYLFRGKNINGDWKQGNLTIIKKDGRISKKGYYICNDFGRPLAHQVIPDTVGMFTGLTDKNGTNIFEKDILSDKDLNFGEVRFDSDMGWVFDTPHATLHVSQYVDCCEVIGNIYENKEV